jgi:hypothetical protein
VAETWSSVKTAICGWSPDVRTSWWKANVACGLLLVATGIQAAPKTIGLEHWVDSELAPYVATQLSTLPRFRNESLQFVVMKDGKPQSISSALAIALRDRLQDALMDTPGIRIAWQSKRPQYSRLPGSNAVDCSADDIHYYVGLELREQRAGEFELSVRALDLEDRSWVSGFGKDWQGPLTTAQLRAWRDVATDTAFLGERDVPFEESQTDLLAAELAHKIGCSLLQQTAGEYIAVPVYDAEKQQNELVELVANNLAAYRALQLTKDADDANAAIVTKAHKVDDDLFQVWVTVRPLQASGELADISASAYVYMPAAFQIAERAYSPAVTVSKQSGALLSNLRLVELDDRRFCNSRSECLALQANSSSDAVVFFLNHQLNHGLVRLGECDQRATARIVRANGAVSFSLIKDSIGGGTWQAGDRWDLNPAQDTYYALAASDAKAARAIARHVEQLPLRCSPSLRSGLEGAALQRWLDELNAISKQWSSRVDWQVIRVETLY